MDLLDGEYEPSAQGWVRDQVAEYEASGGAKANTLRGGNASGQQVIRVGATTELQAPPLSDAPKSDDPFAAIILAVCAVGCALIVGLALVMRTQPWRFQ